MLWNRRLIVRRLASAWVCAGALLGVACSKSPADKSKQLNVYMWSEYIDPAIPAEFEQETGIKVRVSVYESSEEMMAKLQQAGGSEQYDVVVASDHILPVLKRLGLIRTLDTVKLPNRAHLAERFQNPAYDPGNRYSIPYLWGTVGLMYRTDRGAVAPTWATVLAPERQPGPFVLIDSMRDMLAVAEKSKGYSVNTRHPEQVRTAGELVLAAKQSPKCLGFEGGVGGKNKVVSGDAMLAIVYNGDAVRAMSEDAHIDFAIPEEGSILWVDALAIPAGAPNPEGAHKFINYLLEAKTGAKLANFIRYASPNAAAVPLVNEADRNNPKIYPPESVMGRLEYLEDLGADTRLYDEVWTAVKAR